MAPDLPCQEGRARRGGRPWSLGRRGPGRPYCMPWSHQRTADALCHATGSNRRIARRGAVCCANTAYAGGFGMAEYVEWHNAMRCNVRVEIPAKPHCIRAPQGKMRAAAVSRGTGGGFGVPCATVAGTRCTPGGRKSSWSLVCGRTLSSPASRRRSASPPILSRPRRGRPGSF